MNPIIGDAPETDVGLIMCALSGDEKNPGLQAMLDNASMQCHKEGIIGVFVPKQGHLAIVKTGPEKARIVIVR